MIIIQQLNCNQYKIHIFYLLNLFKYILIILHILKKIKDKVSMSILAFMSNKK